MSAAKVVVVTGASSGIGAELARVLTTRGHHVVMAARHPDRLRQAAMSCPGPGETLPVEADITKRESHAMLLAKAIAWKGRCDAWVNNAGSGISRPVLELTDDDLDAMFAVNTRAPLYAMQAVLPHFKAAGGGHLVNVSSLLGRLPASSARAAYSAAKAALNSLTINARVDLKNEGCGNVHVTLFSPGAVATDFGLNAMHGGLDTRTLPSCQPVAEVAAGLTDVLEAPAADVYSRPGYRATVAQYYAAEDVAELEAQPPFRPRQ
eukprot:jgi/Tetstr1/463910/TSEL_008720.t1